MSQQRIMLKLHLNLTMLCAMIFTLFPFALACISSLNFWARASMDPDGGTVAVMTSMPFAASASRIPLQYCMPGATALGTMLSSSNPRSPWARMIGFLGVSFSFVRTRESHAEALLTYHTCHEGLHIDLLWPSHRLPPWGEDLRPFPVVSPKHDWTAQVYYWLRKTQVDRLDDKAAWSTVGGSLHNWSVWWMEKVNRWDRKV